MGSKSSAIKFVHDNAIPLDSSNDTHYNNDLDERSKKTFNSSFDYVSQRTLARFSTLRFPRQHHKTSRKLFTWLIIIKKV